MNWTAKDEADERPASLFVAEFYGGPLDGWVEIREGPIPQYVSRKWYGFDPKKRDAGQPTVFYYELQKVEGASIQYWLNEVQEQP